MHLDPASELATIAREVGAEVLEGNLRYPSGSWQLGDVDFDGDGYVSVTRINRILIRRGIPSG
jgi:hypothetical protein